MNSKKTFVFSIALSGYATLFRKCIKSHKAYCEKHGYEYQLIDSSFTLLTPSESAWLKLVMVVNALEKGYESVFFIDADCLVRPHTPPIQELFSGPESIYLAHGFSGRINSGIIIVRNTPQALDFFRHVISKCEVPVPEEDFAIYENGHMIHYGKSSPDIKIIPLTWNNTIEIDKDSYIQHYSGGPLRIIYLDETYMRWYNRLLILKKKIFKPKFERIPLITRLNQLKKHHSV